MNNQLWWYTARAGGIVGWALLAASVLWGLTISTKATKRVRPNWMLDLHRFLGGFAVVFTGIHVAGIIGDSFVHFGLSEVLVPLASTWRPGAVAWGIVALYVLVAVELSSLIRRRLPKRVWRAIHFASFPLFAFSTVHALTAGTDTGGTPFTVVAAITSTAIIALTVRRINQARRAAPRPGPAVTASCGRPADRFDRAGPARHRPVARTRPVGP